MFEEFLFCSDSEPVPRFPRLPVLPERSRSREAIRPLRPEILTGLEFWEEVLCAPPDEFLSAACECELLLYIL